MNVLELRNDLIDVYSQMRSGSMGLDEAKQAANVAGKILGTAKVQMEYNKMCQTKKKINFLDVEEK